MKTWEIVILIVNVLLAIASGIGAIRSNIYFKKSKQITIYAQTRKALNEIGEMLKRLPDALEAASRPPRKGVSPENTIRDIGKELADHLNTVMSEISPDYSTEFRILQKTDTFVLHEYINSLIDGTAIVNENEQRMLDRISFDTCQERLREMQEYLKKKNAEEAEKLK